MMDILVFAGDISDPAQQRRIASLRALGHDLRVIAFRKSPIPMLQTNDHLDLGQVDQKRLLARGLRFLMAIPKIIKFVRAGPQPQVTLARNLDMVCLALLCAGKTPVIYECLDIHGIFLNGGMKQCIARISERIALRRIARLIVSSESFISCYFKPMQGYAGDWHLLENKLCLPNNPTQRPAFSSTCPTGKIRLGWIGNIRCQPSMDILMAVADKCANVEIHIFGRIHEHALPDFYKVISCRKNVTFHGAYEYPDGLQSVYAHCDLVWSQDLWQAGSNSDWLLPNRIYEAAWHGCSSIAVAGTATGDKIINGGLGYVINTATATSLINLLNDLTKPSLEQKHRDILTLPDADFVQHLDDVQSAITIHAAGLPNVICIGAMRAGTTTLYNYCADHPDIGVSKIKETDFFITQKNWRRGWGWYKSLFPKNTKLRAEFSPNYAKAMVFGGVPQRINAHLPNAKLIYVVRHPVDRAVSQYAHSSLMGLPVPNIHDLISSHEWHHLVDTSSYAKQLKLYQQYFDPSQILVLNFDTLKTNPQTTLSQVAAFLNVGDVWNMGFTKAANTSNSLSHVSTRKLKLANHSCITWFKPYLPAGVKQWALQVGCGKTKRTLPLFHNALKMQLWNALQADVCEFSTMTGITFHPPMAEAQRQDCGKTA